MSECLGKIWYGMRNFTISRLHQFRIGNPALGSSDIAGHGLARHRPANYCLLSLRKTHLTRHGWLEAAMTVEE
jgi:hypothetical protein